MTRLTGWQAEQATQCSCRGADDYCPCQNVQQGTQPKWTIEGCDTCAYFNENGYRNGLKAGFGFGQSGDSEGYSQALWAHSYPRPAVMGCGTAENTATLFDLRRHVALALEQLEKGLPTLAENILRRASDLDPKRWHCRRCDRDVMTGRCGCTQSPSPWEPVYD